MLNYDEIMERWPQIRAYAVRRYQRPVSDLPNRGIPPGGITVAYSHGDTWTVWEATGLWERNRIGKFTEREMMEAGKP